VHFLRRSPQQQAEAETEPKPLSGDNEISSLANATLIAFDAGCIFQRKVKEAYSERNRERARGRECKRKALRV